MWIFNGYRVQEAVCQCMELNKKTLIWKDLLRKTVFHQIINIFNP